ncbi:MAG TPA: hypothetical protein VER06_00700 [Candidatus Methanoperedens sp.]|nr:hypothetical protein [Candidatus Methanoperedens sp.]
MRIARMVVAVAVAAMVGAVGASFTQAATVIKKSGKTWIVDQNSERWDVIQVESLGFDPRGFQYGIGRNAFTPPDDSRVRKEDDGIPGSTRVVGVGEGPSRRAYSVPSLWSHEVANSNLGGKPIAVGY